MNTKQLIAALAIVLTTISFTSCKKSSTTSTSPGSAVNTWTFTQGSNTYSGPLSWDPELNTLLQGNNTYTFGMIGQNSVNGYIFNIVMSLDDTTFTQKTYYSGAVISDSITAFFYTQSLGSLTNIYESTDNYQDIGAVITYKIVSFNPSTSVLVFTFSGQAKDANGDNVPITNGKVTCKVDNI